jgi:hypothetical protein
MLGDVATLGAMLAIPRPLARALGVGPRGPDDRHPADTDRERLASWAAALRKERLNDPKAPLGQAAARVGELAIGTPYVAYTLEEYLKAGGSASREEPLALSLTRFDCVTLVESCLAIARVARASDAPTWERFAREVERMRYRDGKRGDYTSRNHYFGEWISDGARRGLIRDLGAELGGAEDARPLRFMTEHRKSYPALADDGVFAAIGAMERRLDGQVRRVVPTARIAEVSDRIQTGDVLAFATSIPGLDVTTLPEYVAAIKRSTGILVARPV